MASITVIEGGKGRRRPGDDRDAALKRLAIQIAAQLPESPDEAQRVLTHAQTLLDTFLSCPRPV